MAIRGDFRDGGKMTEAAIAIQTDHSATQETVGQGLRELMLERKEYFGSERIFVELRNLVCS